MNGKPQEKYIEGLDGLRALAALSVFSVHFNQIAQLDVLLGPFDLYRLLANGEHAVTLFFILSGFLLSQPFWQAIDNNKSLPSIKRYALKRIARILPAYYLALTLLVVTGNLWRIPGGWFDLTLHSTFLFNFTEFTIMSINPPFWTLAVEIQLYILLPLIFLFIHHLSPRTGTVFIICLAICSYMLHFTLNHSITKVVTWPFQPWLIWIKPYGAVLSQSPLALLPHFLAGLLIGRLFLILQVLTPEKRARKRYLYETIFWICLTAILILLSTSLGSNLQLPYGRYGLPFIAILLAGLIVTTPFTSMAKFILESIPLRWLGLISYGLYIYHYPCLQWCDRIMASHGFDAQQHWFCFGTLSLFMSIMVAAASYYMVEAPVLKLLRNRANIQSGS